MGARSLWRALFRRRELERGMDEEMRFHLEARAADLVRRGLPPGEAARQARLAFGPPERYKEECRQARGLRLFDEAKGDLRCAWRSLRRSPGACLVAVAILTLAIGANVALFTFVDAYALRPLPIAAAGRYVDLVETDGRGHKSTRWTPDEMEAIQRATSPAFEGLYGSSFFDRPVLEPRKRIVRGQAVSPSYFGLLDTRFALGRPFTPGEDRPGGHDVAVLSDVGWRRLMDADPAALGRTLRVGSRWLTVVGVTAPDFHGVEPFTPELWIPLATHAALEGRPVETPRYHLAGILRDGVTPEHASGLGAGVVAGFTRQAGLGGGERRLLVEHRPSFLRADERGQLWLVGSLVLGAFGLVLLIACANLASLHVARASARHQEIATRVALGATRFRLVRQLLTESLLLAGIGAAVGCAFAVGAVDDLQGRLFSIVTEAGLTLAPIEVDGRVLAFAASLGVVAALAFGLLPALEATSRDLASSSRRDGLVLGGRIRPQRLTGALVTAQVAASLVLLVLASLLLRNVQVSDRLDPGFDPGRIVDLRFPGPAAGLVDRVRREPPVAAASAVDHVPLSGVLARHPVVVHGMPYVVHYNYVDHAYFATLGLRLLDGRGFRPDEAAGEARVSVVSAATARALWPGQSPLGRVLEVKAAGGPAPGRYEVIGVAPDVVSGFLFQGRDASVVYLPAAGPPRAPEVIVRPRGEGVRPVEALRALCESIDPATLCEPKTLRELVATQRFPFVAASVIASGLGSLALVLTAIGLYGIVAFAAVQRLREMGVRMALGATPLDVVRVLVGRAARSVLLGLAVGLPVCVLFSRAAARVFRLLDVFDPVTVVGVPVLLAAIALAAALVPAARATAADPMASLRAE